MQILETRIQKLFLPFFILLWIATLYVIADNWLEPSDWKTGDWLINYQGGFVRRGLIGEISFQLWKITSIDPITITAMWHVLFYGIYILFAYLVVKNYKQPLFLVPLLLCPAVFLFQVQSFPGAIRKEIAFFALLFFQLYCHRRFTQQAYQRSFIIILLFYSLIVLTHEMLIIFLPYLLALYFLRNSTNFRNMVLVSMASIPALIALASSIFLKANTDTVNDIQASLGPYAPKTGAILWLDKSISDGFELIRSRITLPYFFSYMVTILAALLGFIPVFYVSEIRKIPSSTKLLIASSFLGSVPLFLIAVDWGRFINIHLLCLAAICLALDPNDDKAFDLKQRLSKLLGRGRGKALVMIVAILYLTTWHLPHMLGYANGDITAPRIKQVISKASSFF